MKLVAGELRTMVCHQCIRDAISAELFLEKINYTAGVALLQLLHFNEIGIKVYEDYVLFAMKYRLHGRSGS